MSLHNLQVCRALLYGISFTIAFLVVIFFLDITGTIQVNQSITFLAPGTRQSLAPSPLLGDTDTINVLVNPLEGNPIQADETIYPALRPEEETDQEEEAQQEIETEELEQEILDSQDDVSYIQRNDDDVDDDE